MHSQAPTPLLPHSFFSLPDGNRLRYALVDPAGAIKGTILVMPGRREFVEKKHAELAEILALGYRLIIVEPRGQGLSSRPFSGDAYQRDHIDDFNTHLNDLRAFYIAIVHPHTVGPLIIHGHSMGGHLALRWLAEDHPPVAGSFVTAPMLAITNMPSHMALHGLSWLNSGLLGHATAYAKTQHDFGGEDLIFMGNYLTHDEQRFRIIQDYFTAHPDLCVGGVTWGWLLAAFRSMHAAQAWSYLSRIDNPVLALVGDEDRITPASDITYYLNLIPRVRTQIIPRARHDLLNESEVARRLCIEQIGGFLEKITA